MKKIISFISSIFGLVFSLSAFAAPASNLGVEKIDDFNSTIRINRDSSINISERIDYDFGSASKYGIYRDIPIKYQARGGNYNLRISGIAVKDENNFDYRFEAYAYGDDMRIKIGDPDTLVSGKKTYVVNYTINRAINYFDSYDEIYWNVTGDKWQVKIEQAEATIILPESLPKESLQKKCFAGSFASTASCSGDAYFPGSGSVSEVRFRQDSALDSGEGLTIVVGIPKGAVVAPAAVDLVFETVKDNIILGVPFVVFLGMLYLWYTRGRDPKATGTIIAQYEAPDNLTPAEVGTIIDEKADDGDISADIINLAVRGYIRIKRIEQKGFFSSTPDYILEKLKSENDLEEFDKKLMQSLFHTALSVKLSNLQDTFNRDSNVIKDQIYKSAVAKGYFAENPESVRRTYILIGVLIFILGVFLPVAGGIFGLGIFGIVSIFISGIIIILFGFIMPARTKKGADTKEYILGLKHYLEVAEKDRINFHNAPERNPKQFEKLLPYAIVLGVEKQWARQFEGIYNEKPDWYRDSSGAPFSALVLAHNIGYFNSHANSVISYVKTSSSGAAGGHSGFSGGGFSGGGFGGGGGGSW